MLDSNETRTASDSQRSPTRDSREQEWEDWWKSDRVDAVGWAALFLWGAILVVAHNTSFPDNFDWWDGSGVFFVGAGTIVLIQTLFRFGMPQYRSKWGWTLFWGTAFLALGLGELASPVWYALPLVAVAAIILKDAFARTE